jgi:hypothetical protein
MTVQAMSPHQASPTALRGPSSRARRRGWLLVAGLLAMVVCAGAFALVYLGADARVQVLAAARPLAAGQTITAGDLQVVRIVPDAGMALLPAGDASRVVGRSVAVPVAAGTLLSQAQLGPAQWPPEGQAVAALPLKPGRLPAGLAAGSPVLVVTVAPDPGLESGAPPARVAPVPATVMHVAEGVDGTGTAVVTLLMAHADAVTVAAAAGDLALVLAWGQR